MGSIQNCFAQYDITYNESASVQLYDVATILWQVNEYSDNAAFI